VSTSSQYTPGSVNDSLVHSRAVEAAIWGMPAVNYDLMLQEMLTKTQAKVGQVIYWGRPLDGHNQTLTPNPDALYFITFVNTKDGPVVLDLPPGNDNGSFNGNIVTLWQMPLADAGLLGTDKGKGGKYLILPPGYKEKIPAGYIPLQSDTLGNYMLFRSNFKSHSDADVQSAVNYGKRMKVYPLSAAAHPPETVFTDVKDINFDSTIKYDASFFDHLNNIVQSEPWIDRDRAMMDVLKSIGIEKGKPYQPSDLLKSTLNSAAQDARTFLYAKYDAGFPSFFPPNSHWMFPSYPDLVKAASSSYAISTPTPWTSALSSIAWRLSASRTSEADRCISSPSRIRTATTSTVQRPTDKGFPPTRRSSSTGRSPPTTASSIHSSRESTARAAPPRSLSSRKTPTAPSIYTSVPKRPMAKSPTGSPRTRTANSSSSSAPTPLPKHSSRRPGSCPMSRRNDRCASKDQLRSTSVKKLGTRVIEPSHTRRSEPIASSLTS
jgi:hypothetical protein